MDELNTASDWPIANQLPPLPEGSDASSVFAADIQIQLATNDQFTQDTGPHGGPEALADQSFATLSDMAKDPQSNLETALFGPATDASQTEDRAIAMDAIAQIGTPDSDFVEPQIMIVGSDDANAMNDGATSTLPDGVLGAYVSAEESGVEGGVILLSASLTADGNDQGIINDQTGKEFTINDVITEESGEAVAVYADTVLSNAGSNLTVAEGDVGDRILSTANGLDIDDSAFVAADSDTVTVMLNGSEVTAAANDETTTVTLPSGASNLDAGYDVTDLTDADTETFVTALFESMGIDTSDGLDSVSISGTELVSAGDALGGTIDGPAVHDLTRFINGDTLTEDTLNTQSNVNSFTGSQMVAFMEAGMLRVETDDAGNVTDFYIDFGQMTSTGYVDPTDTSATGYTFGDYIIDAVAGGGDEITTAQIDLVLQEFFGLDLTSTSKVDNIDIGTTLTSFFDGHVAAGRISETDDGYSGVTADRLDAFFLNGTGDDTVALWRETSDIGGVWTEFVSIGEVGTERASAITVGNNATDGLSEKTPDELADMANDEFSTMIGNIEDFNNNTYYSVATSSDNIFTEANAQIQEAGSEVGDILSNVYEIMNLMNTAADYYANAYAAGEMTEAEAIAAIQEFSDGLAADFAATYNSHNGTNQVFTGIDDVLGTLMDDFGGSMANLTSYISSITEYIPDVQDAEAAIELKENAIVVLQAIGFTSAAFSSIALFSQDFNWAAKDSLLSLVVANDLFRTTVFASSYYTATEIEDVTSLGASDPEMIEAGFGWQDLINQFSGGAFETNSVAYSDAIYKFDTMIAENFPEAWQYVGEQVYHEDGRAITYTVKASLSDIGSEDELDDMFAEMQREVDRLNAEADANGDTTTYYAMYSGEYEYTNAMGGDEVDYYGEGGVFSIRAVSSLAKESGSTADVIGEASMSLNIDNY